MTRSAPIETETVHLSFRPQVVKSSTGHLLNRKTNQWNDDATDSPMERRNNTHDEETAHSTNISKLQYSEISNATAKVHCSRLRCAERNSLFCFPENLSRCFPRRSLSSEQSLRNIAQGLDWKSNSILKKLV